VRTLPREAELVAVPVTTARAVRVHASSTALTHSSFEALQDEASLGETYKRNR
jgi:hypothetical protein